MKSSKKKVFLSLIIITLVGLLWVIFSVKEESQLITENKERMSNSYAIIDDIVILNVSQENNQVSAVVKEIPLKLISQDFESGGNIPSKYTCDGENINPSFEVIGIPFKTKSLVLIMEDRDVSTGVWDHWIKFNIPPSNTKIYEGLEPEGISGKGTGGNLTYSGPCPSDKEHRYYFKIYALDNELTLPVGSDKIEIEKAMEGHVLSKFELIGNYKRSIQTN